MGGGLLEVLRELGKVRVFEDARKLLSHLLQPGAVDDKLAHEVHQSIEPLDVDADGLRRPLDGGAG